MLKSICVTNETGEANETRDRIDVGAAPKIFSAQGRAASCPPLQGQVVPNDPL